MSTTYTPHSIAHIDTKHHAHVVQFYTEDRFLLDELSHFISAALRAGSSAVVIATRGHKESLSQRLKSEGFDLDAVIAAGRYVVGQSLHQSLLKIHQSENAYHRGQRPGERDSIGGSRRVR